VNKVSVTLLDSWPNGAKTFTRTVAFDNLKAVMSKAEVDAKRAAGLLSPVEPAAFYLADAAPHAPKPTPEPDAQADKFETLKASLKAGVKVVSAANLFPTPQEIALRLVSLAQIGPGMSVLEPSAGTGALIRAIQEAHQDADITAIEINPQLAAGIAGMVHKSRCADFLELDDLGEFDRIVMNPPFDHGADIIHISHAFSHLALGGRLVAVCANGPRQREELGEIATEWIELPPGSFKSEGTSINAAIVVLDK
jgi:hypothetical protein